MRILAVIAGFGLFVSTLCAAALPPEYETLKANAEKLYAEGSFAKANELYASATLTNLPPTEQRWVQFRLADTQWRSEAATKTADTSKLDAARHQLEVLVRDVSQDEDKDRVWVEVQESLGDFFWIRQNRQDWLAAWPHYQQALEWWASAPDIELARQRYLATVWRMAKPPGMPGRYEFSYWGNLVPLEILDNAAKIAQSENDQAHAHYLIAMTLRNQGGDPWQRARVPEEFEGAIKAGKSTDWYD
ncbi:MAG TPA: hypothetical protein VK327_15390, partial [Candidatus Paceibacterota bacterium]|nr:hypothetical protein [Candidatus Paceibacterota bacterium]